jgi:TRAP-type C4-dicarboxylate transport system substrate-binding protein
MRTSGFLAAVLPLLAVSASACSGGDSTKAGGSAPPVTLTIGSDDVPGRPAADQILEFARQVEQRSQGRLRIKAVWDADGAGHRNWDQRVARMVVRGELDLGLIPARAWDTEGVASLRALHAPFLVTSDALLDRVVTSELAGDMLGGLVELGLVGLTLVPESLRHPFAYDAPFRSLERYRGARMRAPRSDVAYALIRALGGRADDLTGQPFTRAVAAGRYAAAESDFAFADALQAPTTATANVTLFPKANALVINARRLDGLDDTERRILTEAARRTQRWAIDHRPTDADASQAFCRAGGRVVLAGAAHLAELERAAAPVYAELERDLMTRTLIASIRAMKRDLPEPPAPVACGDASDAAAPVAAAASTATVLDGVYRAELTEDELLARGLSYVDAHDNRGLIRLTFGGGELVISEERELWPDCHGTYRASGSKLLIHITGPGCPREEQPMTMSWTLRDGKLKLVPAAEDAFTRVWWGSEQWRRIADVESKAGIPNGVYRTSLTQAELVASGLEPSLAPTFDGVNTLTLENGTIVGKLKDDGPLPPCIGSYTTSGETVDIRWTRNCDGGLTATWAFVQGALRLTNVRGHQPGERVVARAVFGTKPFEKIG